jgi:hypothetical protein
MLASSAAVLALALGVAGCGSGKASTQTQAVAVSAISKAQFVKRANAICARGNAANKAAGAKLGGHPSEAQITAFVKGTEVPAVQAQIDAIRALGAPSGEAASVTNILELAQKAVDKVKSEPRIITTPTDVFAAFANVAHPYGLTSCAPTS